MFLWRRRFRLLSGPVYPLLNIAVATQARCGPLELRFSVSRRYSKNSVGALPRFIVTVPNIW